MTPAVVFPDPLAATLAVLRDRVPDHVPGAVFVTKDYDATDEDRPALPYARVTVDAAFGRYPATRSATVRIVAHAATAAQAATFADVCNALLLSYEGGPEVRSFGQGTGPLPATDPDTGAPIAAITVQARTRPTPL